jgi:hypothetical protein
MTTDTPMNTHRDQPPRAEGWYWVRPDCRDHSWVPAHYVASIRCWYSTKFGGLSDRMMLEIGEAIVRG